MQPSFFSIGTRQFGHGFVVDWTVASDARFAFAMASSIPLSQQIKGFSDVGAP